MERLGQAAVGQAGGQRGAGHPVPQQLLEVLAVAHLTPVGAFADSPGPYGTYDMAGDVQEWEDAEDVPPEPARLSH